MSCYTQKPNEILHQTDLESMKLLIRMSLRTFVEIFQWFIFTNLKQSLSSMTELTNQMVAKTNPLKYKQELFQWFISQPK